MTQILDITKPAKEIIIDKYNAKSGVHIQYHHVELGQVTSLPPGPQKENTKIELLPTLLAPWLNKFSLSYQRMDLADIFAAPYLYVPSGGMSSVHEILDDINLAVGLNLTADDVEDTPFVVDPDPMVNITVNIQAKPDSVFYIGNADVTMDKTLNPPATSVESNTVIYAAVQKPNGLDYIAAHAFDGYPSTNFSFLKNVHMVVESRIDRIFSCEQNLLVLTGTFSFVSTNLAFITPGTIYTTLVLNRLGHLLAARVEATPLTDIPLQYIDVDRDKAVYYIADTANQININPKRVYRLFENGTLDGSFNYAELDDEVVKIIPATEAFFAISYQGTSYFIKRYTYDGVLDANWSTVEVKSNTGPLVNIDGYAHVDDFGQETLEMMMSDNEFSAAAAPDFIATTVNVVKSTTPTDFFSPFFTISDNGNQVDASGYLAQFNNRAPFNNNYWRPKLVRNVKGGSAVYGQNSFMYLGYPTVVPMLIGADKDYQPVVTRVDRAEKVLELKKIWQVLSGYETYALCALQDRDTGLNSTGILSYGPDHTFNGVIMRKNGPDETVVDLTVMR